MESVAEVKITEKAMELERIDTIEEYKDDEFYQPSIEPVEVVPNNPVLKNEKVEAKPINKEEEVDEYYEDAEFEEEIDEELA